jgi:hypothetical protein
VSATIRKVSDGLPLYDGNRGIALQTQRLLAAADLLSDSEKGDVTFLRYGQDAGFFDLAQQLLASSMEE